LEKTASNSDPVSPNSLSPFLVALSSLRPHQWCKNLLVFLPLLAGHKWADVTIVLEAGLAFVAFCFVASAVYLINDVLDRKADALHPEKKHRAVASGRISALQAILITFSLILVGVTCGLSLPPAFLVILLGYFITCIIYSVWLKKIAALDVVVLAGFYTVRVLAGGVATEIDISAWLLVFTGFFFFSLAQIKRVSELTAVGELQNMRRGYISSDIPMVAGAGLSSGILSVLVIALYVTNPDVKVLYSHAQLLLLACPILLFWIYRLWLLASRGKVNLDPVVFAFRDKSSWVCGALLLVIVVLAR